VLKLSPVMLLTTQMATTCVTQPVLVELQRDWTRRATSDQARAIVEAHGGGSGTGLAYARDRIHPA
jgi:hypothetical protein